MAKPKFIDVGNPHPRAARCDTEFVFNFLSGLDCPRALTAWLLFREKEHSQLVKLEVDPAHYNDAVSFRDAYVATKFLSKDSSLETGIDTREVALEAFRKAEDRCREVNQWFNGRRSKKDLRCEALISSASFKIRQLLGDFSARGLFIEADWGPGVTTLTSQTSPESKFHRESGITPRLLHLLGDSFALAYPMWSHYIGEFQFEAGNRVTVVPKNAKTDRTIAIEPGINLWFQKAVGRMIRRKLRGVGINLNDQSINQRLSREAAVGGHLATVDFSSASDLIAKELVRELFGEFNDWFYVMDALRCHSGRLDGAEFRYEKFSSMGNGFTFELESLIFWAFGAAVLDYLGDPRGVLSVFGDDVILPSHAYPLYRELCEYCGFIVNSQKSYSSGYFRESCGAHWFGGTDCTPFYKRGKVKDVPSIYKAHNGTLRLARRYCAGHRDSRFLRTCKSLRAAVVAEARLCIPEGLGDGGFVSDFDESTPEVAFHEGYQRPFFRVRTLIPVARSSEMKHPGVLLSRLWSRSADLSRGNNVSERGAVDFKIKNLEVESWPWLGLWA
jgi:hypothetical protein